MSKDFDFTTLVSLCRQTHTQLQMQAARIVDTALASRNWLFGWYIVEYEQNGADRAEYGSKLLKRLSSSLSKSLGRGCSVDSLEQMRRFYRTYPNMLVPFAKSETPSRISLGMISETLSRISTTKGQTLPDQFTMSSIPFSDSGVAIWQTLFSELKSQLILGWSHYVELLSIDAADERSFYEIEAAQNSWSVRELKRQIASSLYQRLALSRDKDEIRRLATEGQVVEKAAELIKNPLILEFLNLEQRAAYTENELETAIIDKIEHFLLELGKGFLFEARQKRFTFDGDHYHVDLVFYNRLLRCYVLIDLKRDKLTHQDLGQMQMYVNYFDRHVKLDDELPTVGMVLCHRKNEALVELTLPNDANIFASKYQLYLPSKEELKQQLELAQTELLEDPNQ